MLVLDTIEEQFNHVIHVWELHYEMVDYYGHYFYGYKYEYGKGWIDCPNCKTRNRCYMIAEFNHAFKCGKCKKYISPLARTLFSDSKIPTSIYILSKYWIRKNKSASHKDYMKCMKIKNSVTASRIKGKIKHFSKVENASYKHFRKELPKYFTI